MTKEQIYDAVVEEIVELGLCEKDDLTAETNLRDGVKMDSLDAIELVMNIEERLDLEISDEVAISFSTVQEIVNHIWEMF